MATSPTLLLFIKPMDVAVPTSDASSSPHWYVLYLRSRYEKRVHEELTRRAIESFQPTIWKVREWSDRKKTIEVPLFSGYEFVRIDLRDRVRVLQVDGVVRFVSIDNRPSVVPEEQIQWVRQLLAAPATLRRECSFVAGQLVRVVSGPFTGVRGYVLHVNGSIRVVISIDTIGQAISVEVPANNLKLLEQ